MRIIAFVRKINVGTKSSALGRALDMCQMERLPLSGPLHAIRERGEESRKAGASARPLRELAMALPRPGYDH
jgi:hypothetical protein